MRDYLDMGAEPGAARRYFVSHSSRDKEFALALADALDGEAWIDPHEIEIGDVLLDQIAAGIEAATEFVLLWSANSAGSRWVRFAFHMAFTTRRQCWGLRKRPEAARRRVLTNRSAHALIGFALRRVFQRHADAQSRGDEEIQLHEAGSRANVDLVK